MTPEWSWKGAIFKRFRTATSNSEKWSRNPIIINKHSWNSTMHSLKELYIIFSHGARRTYHPEGSPTTILDSLSSTSFHIVEEVLVTFASTKSHIATPERRWKFKCPNTSASLGPRPTVRKRVWMKFVATYFLCKLDRTSYCNKIWGVMGTSAWVVILLTFGIRASNNPEEEVSSSNEVSNIPSDP